MRKKPDMEFSENTVAGRLLKLRMMAELTQEELCERINYTANYYGQVERGAIELSRKLAEKLRAFYHTTYDYLYYGIRDGRVSEDMEYNKHPIYELLDNCTEEERDMLYQIAKPVIRNYRDHRAKEAGPTGAEEGKRQS